jgi:hypothetical protein
MESDTGKTNVTKNSNGKPHGKKPAGRQKCRWEGSVMMYDIRK